MNTGTREPSRLPVRGSMALAGTVGALALLFSFRGAPSLDTVVVADDEGAAATDGMMVGAATPTSSADAVVEVSPAVTATSEPVTATPVTVTGDPIAIRWGTVQVAVTVDGRDIVDVQTLSLPDGDRHSSQISGYAGPVLREEAIAADSSGVSVISGATYTSRAYAASLQSALDQLGM